MNRAQTKARILGLLRDDGRTAGMSLDYGLPPNGVPVEGIWLGKAAGPHANRTMTAGRKDRRDVFTITAHCYAFQPGQTAEEAETRAQELFAVLEDVVANDPKLGGAVTGLQWAVLGQVELDSAPGGDGEGFAAWVDADINCQSYLS